MRTNRRFAQLWLDALATELGAAVGTIDTYTDDLNCYLAWLGDKGLGLDGVCLEHIRNYIAGLDQRGYSGSTIARRITVVRNLHRFLIAEELGTRDPTSTMPAMHTTRSSQCGMCGPASSGSSPARPKRTECTSKVSLSTG